MKVSAKYYREIEYVLVSELPDAQQELLKQNKDADFIKILMDGQVIGPCLQYKHYSDWYNTVYPVGMNEKTESKAVVVKGLAWQKA